MRRYTRSRWTCVLGLAASLGMWSPVCGLDTLRVVILHSNDIRAQLRPQQGDSLGGVGRRARLIREIRDQNAAVVVDAGDAIAPSSMSTWDSAETAVQSMKMAGYDALAPGNREFDFGLQQLQKRREEAGFPFLCANAAGAGHPFISEIVVERNGIKIGIFGLLWPDIAAKVSKSNLGSLTVSDPVAGAKAAVERLETAGAAYIVGLVHSSGPAAFQLSRNVTGIDLLVAGGYAGLERTESVPVRTQLMDGTLLVTCPVNGRYMGRVDVDFVTGGDEPRMLKAVSTLLPVDGDPDPAVSGFVRARYAKFWGETDSVVGTLSAPTLEGQARIVAALMRRHVNAEVGIINVGAISQVPADEPLNMRQMTRFIRFDDTMTRLTLTGKQLRAVMTRAKKAVGNAQLVYSGLNPEESLVLGRPILDGESYQVVTTGYLADGGDGYVEFDRAGSTIRTGILIRPLVVAILQAWGRLSLDGIEAEKKGVWRSSWALEGSFNRNYIDATTTAYRARGENVSFLAGNTNVTWKGSTRLDLGYDIGRHGWQLENRAEVGQIGTTFNDLKKSADSFETDLVYRYRAREIKVDPFASIGLGTAFLRTRPDPTSSARRPLLFRASSGFQRRLNANLTARVGARAQRDFVVDETDLGAEFVVEGQTRLRSDGRLTSRVKSFFGLTNRRVVSIENYNTLTFPLIGSLSLAVRQNNFLYRVNAIKGVATDGVAFRTDLTVGFVYGKDWKWY